MNCTYAEIKRMRDFVKQEILTEMLAKGFVGATIAYVSDGSAEERLRTYMSAGVSAYDLSEAMAIELMKAEPVSEASNTGGLNG